MNGRKSMKAIYNSIEAIEQDSGISFNLLVSLGMITIINGLYFIDNEPEIENGNDADEI